MLSRLTADSCRSSRTPERSFLAPRRRRTNQDARPAALVTRRRVNRLSPSGAPPNSFSAQLSRSRPSAGPSGTLTIAGTPNNRRHSRSSAYMRFHADRRRPRSRPPTASGALACKLPVGGPQAGAVVAGQVDESFHQERTVPVPLLEVPRNREQAKAGRREVPAGRAGSGSCRGRDADVALASPCPARRPAPQGAALERRTDSVADDRHGKLLPAHARAQPSRSTGGVVPPSPPSLATCRPGTSAGNGTACPRPRGRPPPPRGGGSSPASSSSRRTAVQLACCSRPRASRNPNASQTRRATPARLSSGPSAVPPARAITP